MRLLACVSVFFAITVGGFSQQWEVQKYGSDWDIYCYCHNVEPAVTIFASLTGDGRLRASVRPHAYGINYMLYGTEVKLLPSYQVGGAWAGPTSMRFKGRPRENSDGTMSAKFSAKDGNFSVNNGTLTLFPIDVSRPNLVVTLSMDGEATAGRRRFRLFWTRTLRAELSGPTLLHHNGRELSVICTLIIGCQACLFPECLFVPHNG